MDDVVVRERWAEASQWIMNMDESSRRSVIVCGGSTVRHQLEKLVAAAEEEGEEDGEEDGRNGKEGAAARREERRGASQQKKLQAMFALVVLDVLTAKQFDALPSSSQKRWLLAQKPLMQVLTPSASAVSLDSKEQFNLMQFRWTDDRDFQEREMHDDSMDEEQASTSASHRQQRDMSSTTNNSSRNGPVAIRSAIASDEENLSAFLHEAFTCAFPDTNHELQRNVDLSATPEELEAAVSRLMREASASTSEEATSFLQQIHENENDNNGDADGEVRRPAVDSPTSAQHIRRYLAKPEASEEDEWVELASRTLEIAREIGSLHPTCEAMARNFSLLENARAIYSAWVNFWNRIGSCESDIEIRCPSSLITADEALRECCQIRDEILILVNALPETSSGNDSEEGAGSCVRDRTHVNASSDMRNTSIRLARLEFAYARGIKAGASLLLHELAVMVCSSIVFAYCRRKEDSGSSSSGSTSSAETTRPPQRVSAAFVRYIAENFFDDDPVDEDHLGYTIDLKREVIDLKRYVCVCVSVCVCVETVRARQKHLHYRACAARHTHSNALVCSSLSLSLSLSLMFWICIQIWTHPCSHVVYVFRKLAEARTRQDILMRDFKRWQAALCEDSDALSKLPFMCLEGLEEELMNAARRVSRERGRREAMIAAAGDECKYAPNSTQCGICLDRTKNLVFQCGHQACQQCAAHIDTCPFCRAPITNRIVLFQ